MDAQPSITSVAVDGPLPESEIRSTVERVLGTFRDCYRTAAHRANRTPAMKIRIAFAIDEGRAAHNLRVSGDTLGLDACVRDVAGKLRTRVAPDVGTATVSVSIKFQPTEE